MIPVVSRRTRASNRMYAADRAARFMGQHAIRWWPAAARPLMNNKERAGKRKLLIAACGV